MTTLIAEMNHTQLAVEFQNLHYEIYGHMPRRNLREVTATWLRNQVRRLTGIVRQMDMEDSYGWDE